jgi:hypothetical protein
MSALHRSRFAALALVLVAACKAPPAPPTAASASASAAVAPAPTASAAPAVPVDAAALGGPLVDAWLAAQNGGDFAKYVALYDEANFHGIKRLGDGGEKSYTFATWKADREKMVLAKATVVADGRHFAMKGDTLEATFTQRFRQGSYEDHGKKVLSFKKSGQESGVWKIVREEMKTSANGFNDPKVAVKEVDLSARPGPLSAALRWETGKAATDAPEGFVSHKLRLTISDAKGKKETYDLFQETSDRPVETAPLAPSTTKGLLFEESFWWAGAGDGFRVAVDAEHLVVKHKIQEEGNGEEGGGFDGAYMDELRIALPAGGVKATK